MELPQGECGNYLPINAYNRNTSLRPPECGSKRRLRSRASRHGRTGITSIVSGAFLEGVGAINRSVPEPRTVSS